MLTFLCFLVMTIVTNSTALHSDDDDDDDGDGDDYHDDEDDDKDDDKDGDGDENGHNKDDGNDYGEYNANNNSNDNTEIPDHVTKQTSKTTSGPLTVVVHPLVSAVGVIGISVRGVAWVIARGGSSFTVTVTFADTPL